MWRKFLDGLVFGAGFAISYWIVSSLGSLAWMQMIPVPDVPFTTTLSEVEPATPTGPEASSKGAPAADFFDLPLEESIRHSSAIMLTRYERAPDGKMKAIVKEFLKKEPGTQIYYNVGDEYPHGSFYPGESTRGDGAVIFFAGSPASMKMMVYYTGDRIGALADIPLELFREKCRAN